MKQILLIFLVCTSYLQSKGQWNPDTLDRNQVSVVNYNGNPKILSDENGGYFIGWMSGSPSGPPGFGMQRVDMNGNSLWAQYGLTMVPASAFTYVSDYQVDICNGDSSDAYIIWVNTNSDDRLFAQRFNENGDTLFGANGISLGYTQATTMISDVHAITDDSGGVIVNSRFSYQASAARIGIQRIDPAGNTHFPNLSMIGPTGVSDVWASVKDGNGGGFCLFEQSGVNQLLHFSKDGIARWSSALQTTGEGIDDSSQAMIKDPVSNGCFLSYLDTNYTIRLQYVDTSGNVRWNNGGLLVSGTEDWYYHPTVAPDHSGGAFVGYSMRYNSHPDSIYYIVKHYNSNGILSSSTDTIAIHMPAAAFRFTLRADHSGGAYVCWEEFRNGRICIYAQHYNFLGQRRWRDDGFPVIAANNQFDQSPCPASCNELSHQILDAGISGVVVSWADNRTNMNRYSIYAAKADGQLATGITTPTNSNNNWSIIENPVQHNLELSSSSTLPMLRERITILDISGKIIMEEKSLSGSHFTLDVSQLQSGIYFLQIINKNEIKTLRWVKE